MIDVLNRETVRDAIVAGLTPALTVAQLVAGYQKVSVKGQWPAVLVFTSGSLRPQVTEQGIRSEFYYLAQLWVLYRQGEQWTEAQAEDTLDALEQQLTEWMSNNQVNEVWTSLMFNGRSTISILNVGGEAYLVEEVPLKAEVYQ
jgi:hypothetical protein